MSALTSALGAARRERDRDDLTLVQALRDATHGNDEARAGIEALADQAGGRADRESQQIATLDRLLERDRDAQLGLSLILRRARRDRG